MMMTAPALQFRILDCQISIHCSDELLRGLVMANYAIFEHPARHADLEYSAERRAGGGFRISRDGEVQAEDDDDEALRYMFIYLLEKLVAIDLQKQRTDLYFVHASALARAGGAIMIAAESGTGKSTTAWALLQHGFEYLSDELAPVDPATLAVHPYPHALCLKAHPPGPYPVPEDSVLTERTLHIPPALLPAPVVQQPVPLRALLFLQRDDGDSAPSVSEISAAEASARLYANTLNALAHPGSGLTVAVRIAGELPAFIVHASDLRATCELISDLEQQLEDPPIQLKPA